MRLAGRPISCGVIFLILAVVLCAFPVWWPQIENHLNWIKWQQSSIVNYTIETVVGGERDMEQVQLTVRNGQIVAANPDRLCPKCEPLNLDTFHEYTVEGLFSHALGCFILCSIEYDTQYGFPRRISTPYAYTHVIDFQPLE